MQVWGERAVSRVFKNLPIFKPSAHHSTSRNQNVTVFLLPMTQHTMRYEKEAYRSYVPPQILPPTNALPQRIRSLAQRRNRTLTDAQILKLIYFHILCNCPVPPSPSPIRPHKWWSCPVSFKISPSVFYLFLPLGTSLESLSTV